MTQEETTIGIWNEYKASHPVTVKELAKELNEIDATPSLASQYCDRRCLVNLTRFNYDPYTGEKIDWKKVKKLLEDLVKE